MGCEEAREAISAAVDGEPMSADAAAHVAGCTDCTRFESGLRSLRTSLRFEVVGEGAPDVVDRVLARVAPAAPTGRGGRSAWVGVAAAVLVGVVAGGAFVWPTGSGDVAVAALPRRIVAAQRRVSSMEARVTVVEHGPTRRRTGWLRYRSPSMLSLALDDTTLLIDAQSMRIRRGGRTLLARRGMEPFADDVLAPLDLVLPADGFTAAAAPAYLGRRDIGGRAAIGVGVDAAQVRALLDALRPGGDGREVHPTDDVELWLDRERLVPRLVRVRAAGGPDRARWAAGRGLLEPAGTVVLEARLDDLVLDDPATKPARPLVRPAEARDEGFRPRAVSGQDPAWLPPGMRAQREGVVNDVRVRTWTDGRAWLKVRWTPRWGGGRLFGNLGQVVRQVPLGDGVGYASENGSRVAVHADDVDVVVTGSLEPSELRRVASSLGDVGRPVPRGWAESATVTIAEARADVPGLLTLDAGRGFAAPAVRADSHTVVLVYAGPGERAVVLATREGTVLSPPFDPDAVGVEVRSRVARWSPTRGELDWVEAGRLWSLRSTTVGFDELVDLAEGLAAR